MKNVFLLRNRFSCAIVVTLALSISGCGGSGGGGTTDDNTSKATLTALSITPTNPSIAKGTSLQFTATGTYSDNTTKDLTTFVNWSSSAPSVATTSNAGLAAAVSSGTTTIVANDPTYAISGSTNLTVTAAQLVSIEITPINPSTAKGTSKQFSATGTYTDGSTQNLTASGTWSSSNTAIATISNAAGSNGLATSVAIGTTTITLTDPTSGIRGATTLNIVKAWTQQVGTINDDNIDNGHSITVDTSGNIYVTGYTDGSFDSFSNQGSHDIFIIKYNSAGTTQWTSQFGTPQADVGKAIAVDASGNIYVTGWTSGNLDGNQNKGGLDAYLAKIDSAGKKLWISQFGTPAEDSGYGISLDGNSNIYIVGESQNGLTPTSGSFVTKYDTSGLFQWSLNLENTNRVAARSIAIDTNGNIYVAGSVAGSLYGNAFLGVFDAFLIKYDSFGVKQWVKQIGTTSMDGATAVNIDDNGNVYLVGYTSGDLDGNLHTGAVDSFIMKFSPDGTALWSKQFGAESSGNAKSSNACDVALDSDGNAYIAGLTDGGLDGNINSGLYDMFLAKIDSSGSKLWIRQLGTAGYDNGYSVSINKNSGNVYVFGDTNGGFDGNTNIGGYDVFIVKYDLSGFKQ